MAKAAAIRSTKSAAPKVRSIADRRAAHKRKTNRCTLDVRDVPLELFRHPRDGGRWREPARNRYGLLLRLSTHANADGTFTSEDGKTNFSPSAERLQLHFARRSLYRHLDD